MLKKIKEIEESISVSLFPKNDISLLSGISGIPIFYYSLFELTQEEKYRNKVNEYTIPIFEHLNKKKYSLTYNAGLAGVGFMINYLREKSIYPNEIVQESLEQIDDILVEKGTIISSSVKDLDFLHGSLGMAYYLKDRVLDNSRLMPQLNDLITKIANILLEDLRKFSGVRNLKVSTPNLHKTNCGLAHGLGSFISIFVDLLEHFPKNQVVREALSLSISTLLEFASEDEKKLSIFPGIAVNKYLASYNIHLGWCYGDQSASLILYKAGKFLKDENLVHVAEDIAYKTLKRANVLGAVRSHTGDAGFCHGTSSVAYLYKKWYEITGDIRFKAAYDFFIQETLKRSFRKEGIAGYQKYMGNGQYESSAGLLDGVLGIGLVLIDSLLEKDLDWDRIFILR